MSARRSEQRSRQDVLRRKTACDETILRPDVEPTEEQQAVVDFVTGWSDPGIVRLLATAGAGKTSTLKLIAQSERRRKPELVIAFAAFNRELQRYAQKYFEGLDVDCRTLHSMALEYVKGVQAVGPVYDERQEKFDKLGDLLDCSAKDAKSTWEHLENFTSTDRTFTDLFVIEKSHVKRTFEQWKAHSLVWKLWSLVLKKKVAWTHSHVMKFCQLHMREKSWRLTKVPLDLLLCDEFQDFDGAQLDIVKMELRHARIIAVGDPGQSVYGFRGAVHAFKAIDPVCAQSFRLTKSFRFDAKIARVANRVLLQHRLVGKYQTLKSLGAGEKSSNVKVGSIEFEELLADASPFTLLCSSNKRVFACAAELSSRAKIHVLGKQFGEILTHIENILSKIKQGGGMEEVASMVLEQSQKHAIFEKDWCLKTACEIIGGSELHDLQHEVHMVKKMLANEVDAIVVLATVHQAKGREWDRVVLDNNSFWPLARSDRDTENSHQDINKVYVATTRARAELYLPETLGDIGNNADVSDEEDDTSEDGSDPEDVGSEE